MDRRVAIVVTTLLAAAAVAVAVCLGTGGPSGVTARWGGAGGMAPPGPIPATERAPEGDPDATTDPADGAATDEGATTSPRDTGPLADPGVDAGPEPEIRPAPPAERVDVVAYEGLREELADVHDPRWSTTGRFVAVTVRTGARSVVRVASVALPAVEPLTAPAVPGGTGTLGHPAWFPDGTIAMEGAAADGGSRVWLGQVGSPGISQMPADPGSLVDPAVSRDGRFLAYVTDATGGGDVVLWDRTMMWTTTISASDRPEHDPSFGPDGRTVLWMRDLGTGAREVVWWDREHEAEQPYDVLPLSVRSARLANAETVVYHAVRGGVGVIEAWDEAEGFRRLGDGVRAPSRSGPSVLAEERVWVAFAQEGADNEVIQLVSLDGRAFALDTGYAGAAEPELVRAGRRGPVLLAFTAVPAGARARGLYVADVTALVDR